MNHNFIIFFSWKRQDMHGLGKFSALVLKIVVKPWYKNSCQTLVQN